MKEKTPFPIGTLILACLLAVLALATYVAVKPKAPPAELEAVLRADFKPLAPFQLHSQQGPISEKSLRNKWTLVFFGYLSCPDICPNTLHELNGMQRLLADQSPSAADDLQVLFVSVDPSRDSTELLSTYVRHFNQRFIGATAGKGAIDRLTHQFGAGYVIEDESAPGQYLVSHTSAIFLIDPYGRLIASFSQPHYANNLLALYQKITAYYAEVG